MIEKSKNEEKKLQEILKQKDEKIEKLLNKDEVLPVYMIS